MNSRVSLRIAIACLIWCGIGVISDAGSTFVQADISLPKIFSDHMVLQRDSNIKVWGTADIGQKLVVKFNGAEAKATANAQGSWSVAITTAGPGGPYELEVIAEEGQPKVVFNDVMVGEVWLCSGQCNMALPVSNSLNAKNEIDNSKNFPELRLFSVDGHGSTEALGDFPKVVPWSVCSPETVKEFSAAGYFFGREIIKELKKNENYKGLTIGLIDASWEGTVCEAWTSRAAMDEVGELAPLLRQWDENDEPTSPNRPGNVFNGMIAPITDFPIRGVIWYQGEANLNRGNQYRVLLPTLINDWRKQFGIGDFPFYFVQLAPYRWKQKPPELLAEVRDAQLKTLKSVPNTRMIVTTDIGDLQNINPKNKQVIGRRLAIAALTDVYADQLDGESKSLSHCGPIYEARSTKGNEILLTFTNAEGGLKIRNGDSELNCFTICGDDNKFVPAIAKIDGQRILVSSPDVGSPKEVRFGWNDSAQPNLVNAQGLPASPFRTDELPLISEGREF